MNNSQLSHEAGINFSFSKDEYAQSVVAIAPLNEPAGFVGGNVMDVIRQYWHDSYGNIRFPFGSSTQVSLTRMNLIKQ